MNKLQKQILYLGLHVNKHNDIPYHSQQPTHVLSLNFVKQLTRSSNIIIVLLHILHFYLLGSYTQ